MKKIIAPAVILAAALFGSLLSGNPGIYYAAPTRQGAGDCSSASNPCLISDFWSRAVPGSTLLLLDGTYTTPIAPPTGLAGLAGSYITVKAVNDGMVILDGQGQRSPVSLEKGNNYFWLQGFDAHSSGPYTDAVLNISGNFNVISRVVAWDTQPTYNAHVITVAGTCPSDGGIPCPSGSGGDTSAGYGNLFVDVGVFGYSRYTVLSYKNNGNTFRRLWAKEEGNFTIGYHNALNLNYFSYNTVVENAILRWDTIVSAPYTEMWNGSPITGFSPTGSPCGESIYSVDKLGTTQSNGTCLVPAYVTLDPVGATGEATCCDGNTPVSGDKIYGVLIYAQPGEHFSSDVAVYPDTYGGMTVDNVFTYYPTGFTNSWNGAVPAGFWLQDVPTAPSVARNLTSIAGVADFFGASWSASNVVHGSDLSAVPGSLYSATSGAALRYRYENGVLTSTPLWPWPMGDRIKLATSRASTDGHGHKVEDVNASVQAIFGAFPDTGTTPAATPTPTPQNTTPKATPTPTKAMTATATPTPNSSVAPQTPTPTKTKRHVVAIAR